MKKAQATLALLTLAAVLLAPAVAQRPASAPPNRQDEIAEDEVVRVNTVLVSLAVTVAERNGRYVPHLRQEDFHVFEDGVEQQIAHFAAVETPFIVALLLDTSASTRHRLQEIQEAAISFVEHLRPDDRVAVIAFSDTVEVLVGPTNDRDSLRRAIRSAPLGSGTPLYDAVNFALRQLFNRVVGRKAVVLLTDGLDNGSIEATYESSLRYAEEFDALIYPVQYDPFVEETRVIRHPAMVTGPERRTSEIPETRTVRVYPPGFSAREYERATRYLREMALRTGGRYYHANSTSSINRAFARIAEELRFQYSLGYPALPLNLVSAV